jgi:hypothetical protein
MYVLAACRWAGHVKEFLPAQLGIDTFSLYGFFKLTVDTETEP